MIPLLGGSLVHATLCTWYSLPWQAWVPSFFVAYFNRRAAGEGHFRNRWERRYNAFACLFVFLFYFIFLFSLLSRSSLPFIQFRQGRQRGMEAKALSPHTFRLVF